MLEQSLNEVTCDLEKSNLVSIAKLCSNGLGRKRSGLKSNLWTSDVQSHCKKKVVFLLLCQQGRFFAIRLTSVFFFRRYVVWRVKMMAMSRALRLKRFSALIKRTKCTSCKDKGRIPVDLAGLLAMPPNCNWPMLLTLLPCWWLDCNTLGIIQPTCTHQNEIFWLEDKQRG